jgi:transposase/DNA-binding transcriptional ArsR family regulator
MVLAQMVVDSVVLEGRSIRASALRYGVSKSLVHKLVTRYREGGAAALEKRSTAPHANPRSMTPELEELIIATRKELKDLGTDAGAETIRYHLEVGKHVAPSVSTIYRVLRRRGFVTPEPRKRPRASYIRFQADLPNECWQSDMTHWQLANGTRVEILTFLDDHSRLALACELFVTVKAGDVRSTTTVCRRACSPTTGPSSTVARGADGPVSRVTYCDSACSTNTRRPTIPRRAARSSVGTAP